jgi:hypothetical protein
MSTQTNIAAAAALLTALAAPEISFAQAMSYLSEYGQSELPNVSTAVFGSAMAPARRRAPCVTMPPSDIVVTDPSGNVIGLRRDQGGLQD